MTRFSKWMVAFALIPMLALILIGCDGEGLGIKVSQDPDSGETPSDDGSGGDGDGGGGGGGDGGGDPNSPFAGNWIASYGDDVATTAVTSPNEYAVRISLTQDGSSLEGTGRMFRFFRAGSVSSDEVEITVSGNVTSSARDAELFFQSNQQDGFEFAPRWLVRVAGRRLVGTYDERDAANELARSGHGVWLNQVSAGVEDTWVSALGDTFAREDTEQRDRTARMVVSAGQDNTLSGSAGFIEQRLQDAPLPLESAIIRGGSDNGQAGFTFGGGDLGNTEIDWLGFYTNNGLVTAYGQFDANDLLFRFGHGTWYRSPRPSPSAVNGTWVTAFEDKHAVSGFDRGAYAAVVTLTAEENNVVSGQGYLLIEGEREPRFRRFEVRDGTISGSRLTFDLAQGGTVFEWELRLASNVMAGSYQQMTGNAGGVSTGVAEWRKAREASLTGGWSAAYYDTFGAQRPRRTKLALVEITEQRNDGGLGGNGRLQFADEDSRRLFTVGGSAVSASSGREITWVWTGADLFGSTIWNLRQAGDILFGTYTNQTANGNVESQGHGIWYRSRIE